MWKHETQIYITEFLSDRVKEFKVMIIPFLELVIVAMENNTTRSRWQHRRLRSKPRNRIRDIKITNETP